MDNLQDYDYKTRVLTVVWKTSGPLIIELLFIPSKTNNTKQSSANNEHTGTNTHTVHRSPCLKDSSFCYTSWYKDKWKPFCVVPNFFSR